MSEPAQDILAGRRARYRQARETRPGPAGRPSPWRSCAPAPGLMITSAAACLSSPRSTPGTARSRRTTAHNAAIRSFRSPSVTPLPLVPRTSSRIS